MRYLTLAEALVIAEVVTGVEIESLVAASRFDLLDLALHAPQAEFEGTEFYPNFDDKAAVLVDRVVRSRTPGWDQASFRPANRNRLAESVGILFVMLGCWA